MMDPKQYTRLESLALASKQQAVEDYLEKSLSTAETIVNNHRTVGNPNIKFLAAQITASYTAFESTLNIARMMLEQLGLYSYQLEALHQPEEN